MSPDSVIVTTPLITGFVESLKRAGIVPPRYAAVASLAAGVAASVGAYLTDGAGGQGLYEAVLRGIALGLAASGLYSIATATTGRGKERADAALGVSLGQPERSEGSVPCRGTDPSACGPQDDNSTRDGEGAR
jgi:hypothetical protein